MSRHFILLCIQGVLLLFVIPTYAEDVPTVVVSATRSEQSSVSIASNIQVITSQEIANSGATNVAEVLRRVANVVVADQYGDGSRVSLGVRGFGETANANTLVLVDGRRLNNPDIANQDIYSISLGDIERIEIVHGSAGVLFGDQAVGGVINIITRTSNEKKNYAELLYGSYARKEIHLGSAGAFTNSLSYKLNLEDRAADNYRDHNTKYFQQLQAQLSYQYDSGMMFGEFQYVNDELETPGALFQTDVAANRRQALTNFNADFSNSRTNSGRIGLKQSFSEAWSTEAELTTRHSNGVFRLSSVFAPEIQNAFQVRQINEVTPRIIGSFSFNDREILLTMGVDVVNSDYALASRFGDQFNDQNMTSVYMQGVVPISDAVDITAGIRYAKVSNTLRDAGEFAIYQNGIDVNDDLNAGELGVKYRLLNDLSLHARVDENYRFAKVDEFMSPAYNLAFDPIILKTQTGTSLETGADWLLLRANLSLSVYKLDLNNEIIYDPVNYANINVDSTSRKGLQFNCGFRLTDNIATGLDTSLTRSKIESGIFSGNDVPFVPKKQANFFVDYNVSSAVIVAGELSYTGERLLSGDFTNSLQKLPAYTLANLAATYNHKNMTLKLKINNVLDKQYSEFGVSTLDLDFAPAAAYYPSPERNIVASASARF